MFYRRYERFVAGYLIRRGADPHLAADLTAEVFAAAYLSAPGFRDGPEPAAAWLVGIARNKLLRSFRQARAEASSLRRLGIERIEESQDSISALEHLRDLGALELLAELPEDQRAAVHARVLDQFDYDEIARAANVSPVVARKRVSRGLATLRERITEGKRQ